MAESNTTAVPEIDVDKATLAIDRAFGIVDALYTLEVTGDGISSLCKGSSSALLDAAMEAIGEAKLAINPWMKEKSEVTA